MLNLEKTRKIYFIGIGGIGMSAVAGIAKEKGFEVSGSDSTEIYNPAKSILDKFSISYSVPYHPENLKSANPDLAVVTAGVDGTNPEVAEAIMQNLPIVSYPELLGNLISDKKRIVVVGTHGKGTTAGLLAYILKEVNDSPFFVGAVLNNLNTNFYHGRGPYFVVEGDEYKSSAFDLSPKFSFYKPDVLLINNIEYDHPDIFKDLESYKDSFKKLTEEMSEDGLVVFNADDQNVVDVVKGVKAKKIGFSMGSPVQPGIASITSSEPVLTDEHLFGFDVLVDLPGAKGIHKFQTEFPGLAYAYDNLAAIATLAGLGLGLDGIAHLVKEYKGVKRRYELVYDGEIKIIDDYAHHPTAVKETLEATRRKYPQQRIICFFEPHTYSRTKATLEGLSKAFSPADIVYIAEVYAAREQKQEADITGEQVAAAVAKNHPQVNFVRNKEDALREFSQIVRPGDVVVVMAVGSFNTLVYNLKDKYLTK